jgi:hypothetical protein
MDFCTVFVEYHDSYTNEDVIERFKFPPQASDHEITAGLDDLLHPFVYRILE